MSDDFNISRRLDEAMVQLGMSQASSQQRRALRDKIMSLAELRVGGAIGDKLSDRQMRNFGDATEFGDDATASEMLREMRPNYREVVKLEIEKIILELDDVVTRLLKRAES